MLGPDSFAQFGAVRTPGKVVWCNFDLARQLGFEVPQSNRLTPEFQEQLLAALSFRALEPSEDSGVQGAIKMYADRYGGDGVRPALGAGRAGFLPYGNLYVKGIGFTPLFKHDDPNDFAHSHGAVHMDDCLREAIFGEVNENLFSKGSTRVLAVIDGGKCVTAPSGKKIPVALVARTGAQLRPAHLLGSHLRWRGVEASRLDKFVSIARATGQLVTRTDEATGGRVADVKATMLRIIDDHARTAAEGFRWRMIHGALTSSNMEMSGAMLDLPTQSTQPRTAPIRSLFDPADSVFGREHVERAVQLTPVYRALLRSTRPAERRRFNVGWINVRAEMVKAYDAHVRVQMLCATGLKAEVARRLQTESEGLAVRFTDLILRMAALKNPGTTRAWRSVVESVSVLDVFQLLANIPRKYFALPRADHTVSVLEYLKPVYGGNRFHVSKKRAVVSALAAEFAALYGELLRACAACAPSHYDDEESMQASITARAAFENQPLDSLYSKRLHEGLVKAIAAYRSSGDAEIVREEIDRRIAVSLRSVDALLAQGGARRMECGGVEIEMRTIDGVRYSVRAWNDESQTRLLRLCIPVERSGNLYTHDVPGLCRLTKRRVQALRYRFTTDGWKNSSEAGAKLTRDEQDCTVVEFEELRSLPLVGRLEGVFYVRGEGQPDLKSIPGHPAAYPFAIPDRQELLGMVEGPFDGKTRKKYRARIIPRAAREMS